MAPTPQDVATFHCPDCGKEHIISRMELLRAAGQLAPPMKRPARKMKTCPYCHEQMGTTQLSAHKLNCSARPATINQTNKLKLRPCPYCHKQFGAVALRAHQPDCDQKPAQRAPVVLQVA